MVAYNVFFAILFAILALIVFAILVNAKLGKQPLSSVQIALVTVVTAILVLFTSAILFPLETMRFLQQDPSIPSSAEVKKQFAKVARAIEDTSQNQYRSPADLQQTTTLDVVEINPNTILLLPRKCVYYGDELREMSPDGAKEEIQLNMKILQVTDDELYEAFENLPKKHVQELWRDTNLSTTDAPARVISQLRICAIKKLSYFGKAARNAQRLVLLQLQNRYQIPAIEKALERFNEPISSENFELLIEQTYNTDNSVAIFAGTLLKKLEPAAVPLLVEKLNSKNPLTVVAVLEALTAQGELAKSALPAIKGVLVRSNFPSILRAGIRSFLTLSHDTEEKVQLFSSRLEGTKGEAQLVVLKALQENPIPDSRIVSSLKSIFYGEPTAAETRPAVIEALGAMGPLSADALAEIAYDAFHDIWFLFRSVQGYGIVDLSECQVTQEVERVGINIGLNCGLNHPRERQLRRMRKVPHCSDPSSMSQLSPSLLKAFQRTGIAGVKALLKKGKSKNPGFRSLLFQSALFQSASLPPGNATEIYQDLAVVPQPDELLWNLIYQVKLAHSISPERGALFLDFLTENPQFQKCIQMSRFLSHYKSLGRDILEG